jgi:trans-aconitate 2-methyltransferase
MPSWDADQYLRFEAERTRPCAELVARLALEPRSAVDLGCGPGNSTAAIAVRWPNVQLLGVDSSKAMLETARRSALSASWEESDIRAWAEQKGGVRFDLVFSNAAFQWLPDHAGLLQALMERVAPKGALAFQIPMNQAAPAHEGARRVAASPAWKGHFPKPVREWAVLAPEAYFDLMAPRAARVDLWTTEYWQVMESVSAIVEWYRGTGLRPFLDALPEALRPKFEADYAALLAEAFPVRPSGKVLFPFQRLFVIAYKA